MSPLQYLVVMELDAKPVITPTMLKLSVSLEIDDIIFSGFKGSEDDTCYIFAHLTSTEFL